MLEQDKNFLLREKITKLLDAKDLVCVELSIKNIKGSKTIEVFLAKRDADGILQSPSLDELEEVTDVLELFF